MIAFHSKQLQIPEGYFLELNKAPLPQAINKLLSQCNEDTYPPKKLALALENSFCTLSINEKNTDRLGGFVRITSDKGLNANLWNLVAIPGKHQQQFLTLLVSQSLRIIRRDMPGCSISIAAPSIAVQSLQSQGFLLDPGGIRTMSYRIR